MNSKFEIGTIVEGTITDIKPFGAFVALDEKTKGLVHVSQISHNFINDINEHVSVGDKVNVKIIAIDEASKKISLSIKEANKDSNSSNSNYRNKDMSRNREMTKPRVQAKPKQVDSLEDKLKEWLKQSDDRQATLNKRNKRR